jgi:hypothetical protein
MNAVEVARQDAISVVVGQLPAAVVSVSQWPSNTGDIAAAAVTPATQAFAVVYLLAVLWFYKWQASRATTSADDAARPAAPTARVPFQLAATAAVLVGFVGYAIAPRTYSAMATLRVWTPVPGETQSTMPTATMVRRIAEVIPTTPRTALKLNCDTGEIHITYTALDPGSASERANSTAVSASNTWLDRIFHSALLRAPRAPDFGPPQELKDWAALGGSVSVDVVRPAIPPRWADQFQPIRTATLAAVFAFAVVLPALTLRRDARHRFGCLGSYFARYSTACR